jgi:hypothetical protein
MWLILHELFGRGTYLNNPTPRAIAYKFDQTPDKARAKKCKAKTFSPNLSRHMGRFGQAISYIFLL